MENFEFVSPTHFVFGKAAEEQIGEKLAQAHAKKVLLHFGGNSAKASGLIDRVCTSLDAAGIAHIELGGVRPNPEITLVREGVRICKEAGIDWIVAVGGGSVIDSAKAIANGACIEEDVWTLFENKRTDHKHQRTWCSLNGGFARQGSVFGIPKRVRFVVLAIIQQCLEALPQCIPKKFSRNSKSRMQIVKEVRVFSVNCFLGGLTRCVGTVWHKVWVPAGDINGFARK